MEDGTRDPSIEEREYSLDELSTLANVTPRTVRYYIVEGLLPPPLTGGRRATYSQEHLDRLHAIGSLKDMYLPLREIRHRLNTLTRAQIRDPAYLATLSQAVAVDRAMNKRMRHRARGDREENPSSAADYLDSVGKPEPRGEMRLSQRAPEPMQQHMAQISSQTWERFPLGDDAELMVRSSKVQNMGPRLYRTLHRLRHMIDTDDNERGRS